MMLAEMARARPPIPAAADVVVTEHYVPGPAGAPDVRVLVYTPARDEGLRPAYLHIHGGGYVMGAPEMTSDNSIGLVREIGCVVASVDYRLAPETQFPGAIEDCYAALVWLHAEASRLGIDPGRIAIGGESAGGGLAAALALLARDRKKVPLVFQLLIYPMLDDRTVSDSDNDPHVGEFIWTRQNNRFGWSALLGSAFGSQSVSPYAAAARAEDLGHLPPAYISVGSLDLFLQEDLSYARRLLRSGVPTEVHVYPGAFHGFEIAVDADVTKTSIRNSNAALKRALQSDRP